MLAKSRLNHATTWRALERLAKSRGLSMSGMALRAGLEKTAFNRSKRTFKGKPRWPNLETLAKVLDATGASLNEFTRYVNGGVGK